MKKEILNQLKSDYDKREIKPSADLWDRIEQGMDKTPVLSPKKPFEWMKYAAAVLLLISFGAVFYFNSNKTEKNTTLTKNISSTKTQEEAGSKVEIINSNINHTENNIVISSENKIQQKPETKIEIAQSSHLSPAYPQPLVKEEEKIIVKDNFDENPMVQEKTINQIAEKPVIAERKKTNYIKADELLLGREFDKTREESRDQNKNFGVLDMGKIKFKSPNSFKILGVTVYSDSLETK